MPDFFQQWRTDLTSPRIPGLQQVPLTACGDALPLRDNSRHTYKIPRWVHAAAH